MGVFAHNAACMDARRAGGPACILLHVGSGQHDEARRPTLKNCSGAFTPPTNEPVLGQTGGSASAVDGPHVVPVMQSFSRGESWRNESLACGADAAGSTACVWSNPSGWVDADGTAWINYVLRGKGHASHNITGRGGYGFGLARAPHWKGPYTPVAKRGLKAYWDAPVLPSAGTPLQNCEDSVLYRDVRGDFHMLFHYYGLGASDNGDHGGHAHASATSDDWQFTLGHAYNLSVSFDNGEPAAMYGLRQRPHVVLSGDGELTHVITGVVWDSTRPYPATCTRCTGTRGPCDRSWTTIQPLATSKSEV